MSECQKCGMRNDDWFLCRDPQCAANRSDTPPMTATLNTPLMEEHIARKEAVNELARVRMELEEAATDRDRYKRERDLALRENEQWRSNLRDSFEAMCAMRDAINEHIPMPSLESDLLQGPEASVFCSTVAEAVIAAISTAGDQLAKARSALEKAKPYLDDIYNPEDDGLYAVRAEIDAALETVG